MNDDQLTALAREYAEENLILPDDMPNCLRNEYIKLFADEAKRVLSFLLRRFYLADKEKAKAFYNGDTFNEVDFIELISCRRILKSLFPEIAKEVES